MKFRSFVAVLLMVIPVFTIAAQEVVYVDVIETNEEIARLERENENHRLNIDEQTERKAFLESRIQESEARLAKIEENLVYASETNLELNALYNETKDRETLEKLDASRAELRSVLWILRTEHTFLTEQTDVDKEEVDFITGDNERRESIIANNEEEIAVHQQNVSNTESKISEVTTKLNDIISRLDSLRAEVTTAGAE